MENTPVIKFSQDFIAVEIIARSNNHKRHTDGKLLLGMEVLLNSEMQDF